jgi:hypothetical protein
MVIDAGLDGKGMDIEVQFRPTKSSPKIFIHDNVSGMDLVSMRMRFEGDSKNKISNVRHYVEKEPLLNKLIDITSSAN